MDEQKNQNNTERQLSDYEKRKVQLEHQIFEAAMKNTNEKRKKRTRRLIVRGAMLEKMIPDAEFRSNEEMKHILLSLISAVPEKQREEIFGTRLVDDE